ncbi:TetR family transcriptional regulator [Sphaerisporangium album]|uniref:TetR family transcriptional regulator n=1 Tax=Sphaerisporangium album TaxID=509200 RepID=A0A367FG64_9ACTN|nr:TetR/AcrR family transcriptional regulator C-terminal domain-containing protein [Sphaerisporangium album]RCG28687.1 TetR family transcriptional regulator [Sphaerisporangium album]
MAIRTRQSQRRRQALSRERIIEAAVELLDAAGEGGLTVRALTERLATGSGAIYWHVGTRGELLDAATDTVIAAALAAEPARAPDTPQDEIRVVALGLFDAIAEHQWLATQLAIQLTRSPWGPVTLGIFESIGRQVRALGVPQGNWFTATSALVHYILGATIQNAQIGEDTSVAEPDADRADADRAEFLDAASRAWQELDPGDYPFMRAIADQMREHNDREQFLAGIDLVLTGITHLQPPTGQAHIAE